MPPVMRPVAAHRLIAEVVNPGLALVGKRLPAGEQILVALGFLFEQEALKVEPEARMRDWNGANLPAFRKDREPPALVVEVVEANSPKGALTKPEVEKQAEPEFVTQLGVGGDDRGPLVGVNVSQ